MPGVQIFQSHWHACWRARIGAWACGLALLLAGLPSTAQPQSWPEGGQQIVQAAVSHDAGASWASIPLPDHWPRRAWFGGVQAQYRLQFDAGDRVPVALALRFERLAMHHRVSLNGGLVLQRGDGPDFRNRCGAAPALVDLPPALLQPGLNEVLIEVQHAYNGGLSAPWLGPTDSLRRDHALQEALRVDLPQSLNLATLGLGLFMLTVWMRRRSEVGLGCFGALSLITALRNLAYFTTINVGPAGLLDWFFYSSQVATAVLLGLFARALSGHQGRLHLRLLLGLAVVLPLAAGVCAALDYANLNQRLSLVQSVTRMGLLRRWSYPLLMLVTLPSLLWLLRLARHETQRNIPLLAGSVAALVLGGIHDYSVQVGFEILTGQFLLPYLFPVVLGAVSTALVARMVAATDAAEALARELDQRVTLRTLELTQANEDKARFLIAASHDLRQPVMAIGLLAGLLRERVGDASAASGLVTRLQASTEALESMLTGLLDLSRLDPGTLKLRLQPVPLQRVLTALEHPMRPEAERKGLSLRLRATDAVVLTDAALLEQMLHNLVSNALRYTERGGVLVSVSLRGNAWARLRVWDTGIGIAAVDQSRVFDEFVQLHNPGRDQQLGQGLGLAIVKRGADALGTALSLRSTLGRGSCFELLLPLVPKGVAEGAAMGNSLAAPVTSAPHQPFTGRLFWVLDDDAAVREVLALRLTAWGATVLVLESVAAFRASLGRLGPAAAVPDLLLCDWRLGDGNGPAVIAQARQVLRAGLPCLVVTGDTAPTAVPVGVRVLTKPVSDAALAQAIKSALDQPPRL